MDFITPLLSFATDNSKKLTHRAFTMLAILFSIVLIDNVLGFSFYYNADKKVSLIHNLDSVLQDKNLTNNDKATLMSLRSGVIAHKSLKDVIWDYITLPNFKENRQNVPAKNEQIYQARNVTWHFITASWLWLLFMLIIPLGIFKVNNGQSIFNKLFSLGMLEFFIYLIALGEAKLLFYIPIIGGNEIFNYIINILVNILALFIFSIMGLSNQNNRPFTAI